MRKLNDRFLADLTDGGILSRFRDLVKSDTSLCLEIRNHYINIYYRGGSMMKISVGENNNDYSVEFDENYSKYTEVNLLQKLPRRIGTSGEIEYWLASVPHLKAAMDSFLGKHPKEEREFQQMMLRDNNFGSIARSTDYYICDIEYQSRNGRFDMIAVQWPSTPSRRKENTNRRLAFIEVKHGDGALEGTAGIREHIEDVNAFAGVSENLDQIKEEMIDIFNQKVHLNLIDCGKKLLSFSNDKPLLLLAFSNHDPGKSKLNYLLQPANLPESPYVDMRIVTASFLGYGLYDQGVHTISEAWNRFGKYIYHEN